VIGHEKVKAFYICKSENCKEKNKFLCSKCFKLVHDECKREKTFLLDELETEESKIYHSCLNEV
jgi:hypothetical protein